MKRDARAEATKRRGARAARRWVCAPLAAAVIAAGAGACSDNGGNGSPAPRPTCSGVQAITSTDIFGTSLPPKTLSLSFDDGPGARTSELSTYLAAQGIPSSFFVNGKMLAGGGDPILQQLVADGHVVANHTQTHTSLTGRSTGGSALDAAQVVAEVSQTDALIAPFVANRFMFRAPFGDFDAQTAAALQASPMNKYVGPINWEIGDHMGPDQAADWDCWIAGEDGAVLTPQQCGDRYVKEIDAVGRGIVLLHDPYFIDDDPLKGGTVDLVKHIVPILKAKGYSFVRIDHVPAVAALLPPLAPADAGPEAAPGTMADASVSPDRSEAGTAEAGAPPRDPCEPRPLLGR